ncbi:MAG: hypothetical protein JEZ08_20485 [Clostridiales bacterium]|nr:hypothetical protein [Clostridiales bacterium]
MLTDEMFNIVLIGFPIVFVLQVFLFYFRGIGMLYPFVSMTVITIYLLMTSSDSSPYLAYYTILLYSWFAMIPLGFFKYLSYRKQYSRVVKLCYVATSDKYLKKMNRFIKHKHITFEWAFEVLPHTTELLKEINEKILDSNELDDSLVEEYESLMKKNGFLDYFHKELFK